jgi:Uma2 family endonuclease
MSMPSPAAQPLERIANDPYWLRQFSVVEYHKMVETGILTSNDPVELLEGWIVNKMPQNPPHISSVSRVNRWLGRVLPSSWSLRCQGPITLSDSEPEPDIAIARGKEGTYDARHPERADIGVLMEIGDSSLLADRRYKGTLYAKARMPEFWLINLVERKIEVYTKPRTGKYQKNVEYREKDTVPLVLDGLKIADIPVRELIAKS